MQGAKLNGQLDLLLLSALTSGEAHGYAVITRIQEQSGGRFELLEGSVYPALHRLERMGLVSSRWAREDGRRRRTYLLTSPGRSVLATKAAAWADFVSGMRAVLASHGSEIGA
jgi:DNA-binding PadR family transcriptional regulator